MEVSTKSPKETTDLGQKIASSLVSNKNSAIILALTGELGSGKTTFVQGMADGLGIEQRIISPTFILMRKYELNVKGQMSKVKSFYHVDLYRLEENVESEVKNLGIEEILSNPENIIAIEWSEKIKKMIPKGAKWITFENLGGDERRILVN